MKASLFFKLMTSSLLVALFSVGSLFAGSAGPYISGQVGGGKYFQINENNTVTIPAGAEPPFYYAKKLNPEFYERLINALNQWNAPTADGMGGFRLYINHDDAPDTTGNRKITSFILVPRN